MARPRVPKLYAHLIRDTALRIIDERGLDALTMRALADELGVRAQSLYSYFPSKETLLDAVANCLIRDIDTTAFHDGDWAKGLLVWGRSYRAALAAHPRAAPIIAAGTGSREDFLAMANVVHGGLVTAGWPARQATLISASVKYLVIGAATTPFGSGFSEDPAIYDERHPHLTQAHRISEQGMAIDHESFELALTSLIAGLRQVYLRLTGVYLD